MKERSSRRKFIRSREFTKIKESYDKPTPLKPNKNIFKRRKDKSNPDTTGNLLKSILKTMICD